MYEVFAVTHLNWQLPVIDYVELFPGAVVRGRHICRRRSRMRC